MADTQETNEFDRVKYLENLLKISQEIEEERAQRIIEQQNTIGSLTDEVDKMKRYIYKCWREEELNDYSNYITNTDSEFRELVDKLRNGRKQNET